MSHNVDVGSTNDTPHHIYIWIHIHLGPFHTTTFLLYTPRSHIYESRSRFGIHELYTSLYIYIYIYSSVFAHDSISCVRPAFICPSHEVLTHMNHILYVGVTNYIPHCSWHSQIASYCFLYIPYISHYTPHPIYPIIHPSLQETI